MDKLFGDLKHFFKPKKCAIDNWVFRLHYKVTLTILIAFSIAVTGRQFIGDPIDCISKDDIPESLLETFCWISTTFSIKSAWKKEVGVVIPYPGVDKYTEGEERVYHAYYQWVCFVLFLQALLFYVPRYIWRLIEGHRIENLAMDFNNPVVDAETDESTDLLVHYLKENIGNHTFFGTMYSMCEIMNFVNVLGQIFLMDTFLGGEFSTYGTEVVAFTEWDYSLRYDPMIKVFPRMSKCTFYKFGSSGDVQKHDAMCLLPINILNEKIYIFLWFWFVILAIISFMAVAYRIAIMLVPQFRYFLMSRKYARINKKVVETVLSKCDRDDFLILSFIGKNVRSGNFRVIMTRLSAALTKAD